MSFHCAQCGIAPHDGQSLLTCGRCHAVRYCSAVCQKTHWKDSGHKQQCAALAAAAAAPSAGSERKKSAKAELRQLARAADEKKKKEREQWREERCKLWDERIDESDYSKCSLPGGGSLLLTFDSGAPKSMEKCAQFMEKIAKHDVPTDAANKQSIRRYWIRLRPELADYISRLRTSDHWTTDGSPFEDDGGSGEAQWSWSVDYLVQALQKLAKEGWFLERPLNSSEAEQLLPIILMISANLEYYGCPDIETIFGAGMGAQRAALEVVCSMLQHPTHGQGTMVRILRAIMGGRGAESELPEDYGWIEGKDVQLTGRTLKAVLVDPRTPPSTKVEIITVVAGMFLTLPHFAQKLWRTGVGAAIMRCYATSGCLDDGLCRRTDDWEDSGAFLYAASEAIWAANLPKSRRPYTLSPEGLCTYDWSIGELGMYASMKEAESWAFFDEKEEEHRDAITPCDCCTTFKSNLRCGFFEYNQKAERSVEVTMQLAKKVIGKARAAISAAAEAEEIAALTGKALSAARKFSKTWLNSFLFGDERANRLGLTQEEVLVEALTLECAHGRSSNDDGGAGRPLLEELVNLLRKDLTRDSMHKEKISEARAARMLQVAEVHARLGELAQAKEFAEYVIAGKMKMDEDEDEDEGGDGATAKSAAASSTDSAHDSLHNWQRKAAEFLAQLDEEEEESAETAREVQRPTCKEAVEATTGVSEVVHRWSWKSAGADQFGKYRAYRHIEVIERLHVCVFKLRANLLVWDYENEEVFHWLKHVPHMLQKWTAVETPVGTALILHSRDSASAGENKPRVVILDQLGRGGTTSMLSVDRYYEGHDTFSEPDFPVRPFDESWWLTGMGKTVLPHVANAWPALQDGAPLYQSIGSDAKFDGNLQSVACWYERAFCSMVGDAHRIAVAQQGSSSSWAIAVPNPRITEPNTATRFGSIGVIIFDSRVAGGGEEEERRLRVGGAFGKSNLSRLGILSFPFLLPPVGTDLEGLFLEKDGVSAGLTPNEVLSDEYSGLIAAHVQVVYLNHTCSGREDALSFCGAGDGLPPLLLSCGKDHRLGWVAKVWRYASQECLFLLDNFQRPPTSLAFADGLLFAAISIHDGDVLRTNENNSKKSRLGEDKVFVFDCSWSSGEHKDGSSRRKSLLPICEIPNPRLPDDFDLAAHQALSRDEKKIAEAACPALEERFKSKCRDFNIVSLTAVSKHRILAVEYGDNSLYLLRYAAPASGGGVDGAGFSEAVSPAPILTYLRHVRLAQPSIDVGMDSFTRRHCRSYPLVSFAIERSCDAIFAATYPYLLRIPCPPLQDSASASSSPSSSSLAPPPLRPPFAAGSAEVMNCAFCGLYKGVAASQLCGGCKSVRFCDTACIKAGWKSHSSTCKGAKKKKSKKKEVAEEEPPSEPPGQRGGAEEHLD